MRPLIGGAAALMLTVLAASAAAAEPASNGLVPPPAAAAAPAAPVVGDPVPASPASEAVSNAPASTSSAPISEPAPASTATSPAEAPKPAPPKPPAITLAIDIDLSRQHMTIKERGVVVGSWPISSGRAEYRTPTGTFRPLWQSRMWYSKKYDNAPMPHAVFFNGGVAMHATQATGMLGRPASHGCIRQAPANAARTYALVTKHGYAHTRIVVRGTPRDSTPAVARNDRPGATRSAQRANATAAIAPASAGVPLRRVVFVDSYGNRRIGSVRADDPRLASRRVISTYRTRSYSGGDGVGGYPFW